MLDREGYFARQLGFRLIALEGQKLAFSYTDEDNSSSVNVT